MVFSPKIHNYIDFLKDSIGADLINVNVSITYSSIFNRTVGPVLTKVTFSEND